MASENSYSQRQQRQFDEIGEEYTFVRRHVPQTRVYHQEWRRRMQALLPRRCHQARFLDVMCGAGHFLCGLSREGRWAVGLDISLGVLRLAGEIDPQGQLRLVQADAMRLPFLSRSFEAIVSLGGVHHVPNRAARFVELARVLKPKGRLIVSAPCDDVVLSRCARRWLYRQHEGFDANTESGLLSRRLAEELTAAGLSVERLEKFGYLAYILLAQPQVFRLFRHLEVIPGITMFARVLMALDRLLECLPLVN